MMPGLSVLVAEDEILIRKFIAAILKRNGCSIAAETASGEDAVRFAREQKPDLAVLDIRLKGRINGVDAALQLQETGAVPVIFISAYNYRDQLAARHFPWLIGYLSKPVADFQLEELLRSTLSFTAAHNPVTG